MAGENSNEKHEEIFEHEFEILQRIKEHFQVTSDKDSNLVEYKILGENYEQLLRQSIKLMKIGDSTQRRLIKTQNQLQEANDQIEKSYNNLKALSQFGQSITASLDTKEIILSVHKHIEAMMSTDILSIGMYEEDKKMIKYRFCVKNGAYVPSLASERLKEKNFSSLCFEKKQEIIVEDIYTEYPDMVASVKELWDETTKSLAFFPLKVEDRFIGILTVQSYGNKAYSENQLNVLRTLASYVGIAIDNADAYKNLSKKNKQLNDNIEKINSLNEGIERERQKSEKLLLNILPASIAERLKAGENVISDFFPEATVMFADLAGFTKMSAKLASPEKLVIILNDIFTEFDMVANKYGLEKIKTIGDCYMVAGGIPVTSADHTERVGYASIDMLRVFTEIKANWNMDFGIRIGMHVGSIVAGVIGQNKFVYDLWGDTVNTASRMESHGVPGRINCSQEIYNKLKDKFVFEDRGEMEVKGKGIMHMFFLNDKK